MDLGCGGSLLSHQNLTYGVYISYLIDTDTLVRLTKEKYMYTVSITWSDKTYTHKAVTRNGALSWLRQYPNQDVFGKVTNLFGNTVAVKYHR